MSYVNSEQFIIIGLSIRPFSEKKELKTSIFGDGEDVGDNGGKE